MAVLALAIGANTGMFSVLNATILRPLPYRSPARLAMLWSELPNQNHREGRSAYWNVEQWRAQSKSFAGIAAFDGVSVTLTSGSNAEQIRVLRVSPDFFSLIGVQPFRGRVFSAQEAEQRRRLILISYPFWQTHFGGSADAIGASITLDGLPSRILGILPAGFEFPGAGADAWESDTTFPDWDARRAEHGEGTWFVVGRLRPHVTFEQAQAEMNTIARRLDQQLPASERSLGIRVVPLSLQVAGPRRRLALWMLTGAVFCVLLIAATNIASLSLARSAGRQKEFAIRAALGASRRRLVRQLLAESLTLAVLSGLLGLWIADAGIRFVLAIRPDGLARLHEVHFDPQVLGWTLGLCLLTGILVGVAPAITVARRSLMPSGRADGRGASGGVAAREIRRALVVAQFALAIILLVGAGLLIRSLWSVRNVNLGFRPERVLAMQIAIPDLAPVRQANLYQQILEQVESLPGVKSAGVIGDFLIGSNPQQIVMTEGNSRSTFKTLQVRRDEISRDFFAGIGTPLVEGRFFSAQDGPNGVPVAIINKAMARRLWPGRNPVGKRFKLSTGHSNGGWFTVVGVVADMHRQGLENKPVPQMFQPLAQSPSRYEMLLVRTSTHRPMRTAAVHRVAKNVPVYQISTLEDRLRVLLAERRFQTALLAGFSIVALILAAIGIYGLIHYSVATRTQEIGIRMAVGAEGRDVFRMVIGEGLKLSLTGLALGLVGALALVRTISGLLFDVSATDPLTLVAVSVLLVGTDGMRRPTRPDWSTVFT